MARVTGGRAAGRAAVRTPTRQTGLPYEVRPRGEAADVTPFT